MPPDSLSKSPKGLTLLYLKEASFPSSSCSSSSSSSSSSSTSSTSSEYLSDEIVDTNFTSLSPASGSSNTKAVDSISIPSRFLFLKIDFSKVFLLLGVHF